MQFSLTGTDNPDLVITVSDREPALDVGNVAVMVSMPRRYNGLGFSPLRARQLADALRMAADGAEERVALESKA